MGLLVFAPSASAGTIELKQGSVPDGSDYYEFRAAPGERNDIVVERLAGAIRLTDTGAPPSGCTPDGPDAVRCERDLPVTVWAGDGDDTVRGDGALSSAIGEAGNDHLISTDPVAAGLSGGAGDDVLEGGPGTDDLDGGPGSDHVSGGAGRDNLNERVPSTDVLDGGEDEDRVSYSGRTNPVRVDLNAGTGGEAGENDVITGVEDITGGAGSDVLLGDDRPNRIEAELLGESGLGTGDSIEGRGGDDQLDGGVGDDTLIGGAGADTLAGERGKDRYDGGPGRDRLWLESADAPDVRCGTGTDTAFIFKRTGARLRTDCERVEGTGERIRIHRGSRRLKLELRWATREAFLPCRTWVNGTPVRGTLSPRRARFITLPRSERITIHSTTCHGGSRKYTSIIGFRLTS